MWFASIMRKVGWICFGVMWIPFTTLFIGMIGMPEGSYDIGELPLLARFSLLAVVLLGAMSMILLIGAVLVSSWEARTIRRTGLAARATVLEIYDTGTTINENPVVRLVLEVQPDREPPFQAETEQLIPRLKVPQVQPGMKVRVKYDPDDYGVALLDLSPEPVKKVRPA